MAPPRKVLIADPDVAAVRALTKALRSRGYQVQHASDGSKALELSVLRHPDVVLFDETCTLIEARSFIQILGSNPRTEDIPVVVTTSARDDRFRGLREGVLLKPFNLDEVISRIDHLCRRGEAAQDLRGDSKEVEGRLTQLPLPDLLQIMAMNRRTGKLALDHGGLKGEIQISQGRAVNARLGDIEGEKALFRLLGWHDGNFAFTPGPAPSRSTIDRVMEDALLEGMRQNDERARLMASLPPLHQMVALMPDGGEVIEPHPVTKEILRVLSLPRRISELLDLADAPDLDLLGALTTLLEKGLVQRYDAQALHEAPLLNTAEVHALRGRLLRGRAHRHVMVAKVVLCGAGPKAGRWFLRSMPGLDAVAVDPGCLRSSFGTLASLRVSEVLKIDFVLAPTSEAARPLWRPFLSSALGALVLEDGEASLKLAKFCAIELRLPIVVATGPASGGLNALVALPSALRGAPSGALIVGTEVSASVRALLLASMQSSQTLGQGLPLENPAVS
jgi:CheY-like chemotaxis protein